LSGPSSGELFWINKFLCCPEKIPWDVKKIFPTTPIPCINDLAKNQLLRGVTECLAAHS
jgi:hypothetical protein